MTLTKEALLAGKSRIVEIEVPGYPEPVKIRPVTFREWSIITTKRSKGITFEGEIRSKPTMKMEMEKITEGGFEGQGLLVYYGLVDPVLTLEEIYNLKPSEVKYISDKIREISGVTEEDEKDILAFRPDT